jgi:hypothetical protein
MMFPSPSVAIKIDSAPFVTPKIPCPSLRLAPCCLPLGRAKSGKGRKLSVTELDMCGANHTWLKAQCVSNIVVNLCGGVVSHDEVVAVGVLHLMH